MNHRLVTPVIVLVSFTATFGLMSWNQEWWHAAPDSAAPQRSVPAGTVSPRSERVEPTIAPLVADEVAPEMPATATPSPDELELAALPAPPESAAQEPPGPRADDTDAFLADQGRLAQRSARAK